MGIKASFTNYAATATLSAGPGSGTEHANFPRTNLKYPHRPFVGWRSTTIASYQDIQFDFGAAVPLQLVVLVNCNFASVELFADDTGAWSPTDFTAGTKTLTWNYWTQRLNFAYDFTAPSSGSAQPTLRYFLIRIPAQATIDGAAYFRIGGVWVGAVSHLDEALRWGEEVTVDDTRQYVTTWSGAVQTCVLGYPKTIIHYRRKAQVSLTTPGTGDQLAGWRSAWDMPMRAAQDRGFAWYLDRGSTEDVWIMRKTNESAWPIQAALTEDDLILEEAVGP